jgi:hypothetical protein
MQKPRAIVGNAEMTCMAYAPSLEEVKERLIASIRRERNRVHALRALGSIQPRCLGALQQVDMLFEYTQMALADGEIADAVELVGDAREIIFLAVAPYREDRHPFGTGELKWHHTPHSFTLLPKLKLYIYGYPPKSQLHVSKINVPFFESISCLQVFFLVGGVVVIPWGDYEAA